MNQFFDEAITAVDPSFFARMKASNISPKDPAAPELPKQLIVGQTDHDFYDDYPTIYHLRQKLMTEHRKFDIREVYLAIHHIIKYRGHFLTGGAAKDFKPQSIDYAGELSTIFADLTNCFPNFPATLTTDQLERFTGTFLDQDQSRPDRKRLLVKLLTEQFDAASKKQFKPVITELVSALLGLTVKVNVLLNVETDDPNWKFSFEALQDALPEIESDLSTEQYAIVEAINTLYTAGILATIIPNGQGFSEAMVARYEQHAAQLKALKEYLKIVPDDNRRAIHQAYNEYIHGNGKSKPVERADFYKTMQKLLKGNESQPAVQAILQAIDRDDYLLKLRTKANGAIPYQIQQQELDTIIANQSQYYPWLAEQNPVEKHRNSRPYKLDELIAFRVPYYFGPLVTAEDQKRGSGAKFAWLIRKEAGEITPWNIDEKVDRTETATKFIERMKTTDTYLLGETVLPQQSLIYQRFTVLNELNNVRINGELITRQQKQGIFKQLFMQKKTVTIKDVQKYLVNHGDYPENPTITGLADLKKFNSQYSTYQDLKQIIPDALNEADKQSDIEKIIEWSTIFEDRHIFAIKLGEINWLSDEQRRKLSNKRYRGWGQLSAKLLTGIVNDQGQSILDQLWETSHNFMQIQSWPEYAKQIQAINEAGVQKESDNDLINDLYTSPQNKKEIREVLKVVADIQKAQHGIAPEHIYIEAARGSNPNEAGRRSVMRQRQLEKIYATAAGEIDSDLRKELKDKIADRSVQFKDRLFLYFQQNGRDMYTGKRIDIDNLSHYDIDHILPQSLIKDNSLDNRVLVSRKSNREDKAVEFASEKFSAMIPTWRRWNKLGMISQKKLNHLLMKPDEINKYATGFINRQLVETRQIIKLVTTLLADQYTDDNTEIVSIKAGLSHQLRHELNYPKIREVNDHHHAFDAYLAAMIGAYLLKRYPKLERFFVYGKFQHQDKKSSVDLKRFNFIHDLVKAEKNIVDKETGEIIWDKDEQIKYFDKLFNLKKIQVTRPVEFHHGAMFKQTVLPASADSRSSLIQIKGNRPTSVYGGYTNINAAYFAVIRTWKKGIAKYYVKPVPTMLLGKINNAMKTDRDVKELLHSYFESDFTEGRAHKTIDFEVILPKVGFEQTFIDDRSGVKHAFAIGSAQYLHNLQQLFLPLELQRAFVLRDEEKKKESYEKIFDYVCQQVKKYFPLYDVRKQRAQIIDNRDNFLRLGLEDQRTVLIELFKGLHASAARGNLKAIGSTDELGKLNLRAGIKFTDRAVIVYQSSTGLFNRKVSLSSL